MQERRKTDERRRGEDRRSWECQLDFPYVDSHGALVTEDRRLIVERRLSYPEQLGGDRRILPRDEYLTQRLQKSAN